MDYKRLIVNFYQKAKIKPNDYLADDLNSNNLKVLFLIEYAIKSLLHVTGIVDLLIEIGKTGKKQKTGHRIYHNLIQELHSIYFVKNTLKHDLVEVESRKNKVLYPNSKKNKSCDIKSFYKENDYYFESKDFSNYLISTSNDLPKYSTEENEAEKWIAEKSKEADFKGANYLICRPDLFLNFSLNHNNDIEHFYNSWIYHVCVNYFKIIKRISTQEFFVQSLRKVYSPNFYGIFIVKSMGFIKLSLKCD